MLNGKYKFTKCRMYFMTNNKCINIRNQTASQKLEEEKKILKNKCIYTFIWILNTLIFFC